MMNSQTSLHMPIIPILRKLRQEHHCDIITGLLSKILIPKCYITKLKGDIDELEIGLKQRPFQINS